MAIIKGVDSKTRKDKKLQDIAARREIINKRKLKRRKKWFMNLSNIEIIAFIIGLIILVILSFLDNNTKKPWL